MIRFRDFISEDYYYHGTTPANADRITSSGFDPSKSKYGGKLFLTRSHSEASKYGKIANGGKLGVVLRVHKKHLDPEHTKDGDTGIIQYGHKIEKDHISRI